MLGNRCLDLTEKPPSRPTDYVIRHILHISRPNSNVGSEWRISRGVGMRVCSVKVIVVVLSDKPLVVGLAVTLFSRKTERP